MPPLDEVKIYLGLLRTWKRKLKSMMVVMTDKELDKVVTALLEQCKLLGCEVEELER